MGKETTLFKHEEKIGRDGVVDFLRQLADRVEEGKVVLKRGKKEVKVKVPGKVELEVKIEKETGRRKTKKKLEVEIEWVVGQDEQGTFTLA